MSWIDAREGAEEVPRANMENRRFLSQFKDPEDGQLYLSTGGHGTASQPRPLRLGFVDTTKRSNK